MTLNIRAYGVISNPSQDTPMFSSISAKRIATLDARLYDYVDGSRSNLVGFGEGTLAQRAFIANGSLKLPAFKNSTEKYFDLSDSSMTTDVLTDLINSPITLAYVIKIDDWSKYKDTILEMSQTGSARLFVVGSGSISSVRHLVVPTKNGIGAWVNSYGTGQIIQDAPTGWFIQVIHFNAANSKVIDSKRNLSTINLLESSETVDRIYMGARVGYSETIAGVAFKHFSVYSGTATEDDLLTLFDELKLSFGI